MAYDDDLAERVRVMIARLDGVAAPEIAMFGGIAFMVNTHMAVGVTSGGLMVRVTAADRDAARAAGAQPLSMGTRTMNGWLVVPASSLQSDADLESWVGDGVATVRAMAPKHT